MIIGIAGASCSGKTTLAKEMAKILDAKTYHLDQYFIENAYRPLVNGHMSFEQPHQYDGMGLLDKVAEQAEKEENLIVEGFLLFLYPGFTTICERMIYLDVPYDELVKRRKNRINCPEAVADVAGGRIREADIAWLAHGEMEWRRYGEMQASIPGMEIIRPEKDMAELARDIIGDWQQPYSDAA